MGRFSRCAKLQFAICSQHPVRLVLFLCHANQRQHNHSGNRSYRLFLPEGSWYKPGKVNQHILEHEPGHFDITEIHARKFRNALEDYRPGKNIKEDLQKIYQRIETKRDQMQKAYDRETNHSKNVEKEKHWQQKIAGELHKLKHWK